MTYKLVCFDLDGTLIENTTSIWVTIHEYMKVDPSFVQEGWDMYKRKKISWTEWADRDLQKWRELGGNREKIQKAIAHLTLFPGARETLCTLKERGMRLGLISGSLHVLLDALIPDNREIFDEIEIAELLFNADGTLKGFDHPDFVEHDKAHALLQICERLDIAPSETVFVGDHHNDLAALRIAGLGIAFSPENDEVRKAADVVVEERDVRAILPFILTT